MANMIYSLLDYPGIKQDMYQNSAKEIQDLTWGHSANKLINVYQKQLSGAVA